MLKLRNRIKNEKGFTLVELMVVIAIIGVLATIGLMKMQDATAAANGAKIVADLRTIDSAIMMAQASGQTVSAVSSGAIDTPVSNFLNPVPKPPTNGYYFVKGLSGKQTLTGSDYRIAGSNGDFYAVYDGKSVRDLTSEATSSSGGSGTPAQ